MKSITMPKAGFTLVELLGVILIIGILAAGVLGLTGLASKKSDEAKTRADLERVRNALEEYRVAYGYYPANADTNDATILSELLWVEPQADGKKPFLVLAGWEDPSMAYDVLDTWGNGIQYLRAADEPYTYRLWSRGADVTVSSDDIEPTKAGF